MAQTNNERGTVTAIFGVIVVLLAAVATALATYGGLVVDRARAVDVADAAALAGSLAGRGAAEEVATQNSSTLTSWTDDGDEVEVTVQTEHGGTARARAHHHDHGLPIEFDVEIPAAELAGAG